MNLINVCLLLINYKTKIMKTKNKQYLRLFIITFALSMLFLTSCKKEIIITDTSIVGTWDVIGRDAINNQGEMIWKDLDYKVTYHEDGTWTQNNATTSSNATWAVNGSEFIKANTVCVLTWTDPGKEWNYSYSNGDYIIYMKK